MKKFRAFCFTLILAFSTMMLLHHQLNHTRKEKQSISSTRVETSKEKIKYANITDSFQQERSINLTTSTIAERMLLSTLSPCNITSNLQGKLAFNIDHFSPARNHSEMYGGFVKYGGMWSPNDCIPPVKVAILIPYRKRPQQLEVFLSHMHPIFQRQKLDYRIFVIEQAGSGKFNKGGIYNIGFNITQSYDDYDCYIFHDIDLLSEDDRNFYGCPMSPMHMSPAIDKFKYKLPYTKLFGGIQAFSKRHYRLINGYSNSFWGWGAEDDNLYQRVTKKGLRLSRPSMEVGVYKMNKAHHFRSDGWSKANMDLLYRKPPNQDTDGLNSIQQLNFEVKQVLKPLFTLISINLKSS